MNRRTDMRRGSVVWSLRRGGLLRGGEAVERRCVSEGVCASLGCSGNVEVEGQRGDLNGAGMVCPGMMEVNRTARTQQGGRPVYHRDEGRRFPLCPLDLYRESG